MAAAMVGVEACYRVATACHRLDEMATEITSAFAALDSSIVRLAATYHLSMYLLSANTYLKALYLKEARGKK